MIRTKGEAGTGNVVSAVKHARLLETEIETAIRATPEGRDKMVESIMDGYSKLEDYSDIGARVTSTPFGDLEDLRNEVSSVLKEVTEIEVGFPWSHFLREELPPLRRSLDDESWNGWCFCWIWYFQEF